MELDPFDEILFKESDGKKLVLGMSFTTAIWVKPLKELASMLQEH